MDILKSLQNPALILLGFIIFLMFNNKDRFSKIGRDPTSKIFTYTFYTIFAIAIISVILPILNKEIGPYYSTGLIAVTITLLIVADTIKKLVMQPIQKISQDTNNTENESKQLAPLSTDSFSTEELTNNNSTKSKNNQNIDLHNEINNLLLYKKALLNDNFEAWQALINYLDEQSELQQKIHILKIAAQRESIKNSIGDYIKILSELGSSFLDNHDPLKTIDTLEHSISLNTSYTSPASLIDDCINLGRAYILVGKNMEANAMFKKARDFYDYILNNRDIEVDQEDVSLLKDSLSRIPLLPKTV